MLSAPVVLTRLIVLAMLAGFIGLVYLALPVGLGTLLGTGPEHRALGRGHGRRRVRVCARARREPTGPRNVSSTANGRRRTKC